MDKPTNPNDHNRDDQRYRIFVVDDHQLVRKGMQTGVIDPEGWELVGEADTARSAIQKIERCNPDIVLLDLGLDDAPKPIKLVQAIREKAKHTKILVVSVEDRAARIVPLLREGVHGYAIKGDTVEQIGSAIRAIMNRETYVSQSVAGKVIELLLNRYDDDLSMLTAREREVFELLREGLTPEQIADKLGRDGKTIRTHLDNIRRKTGIKDLNELKNEAFRFKPGNP